MIAAPFDGPLALPRHKTGFLQTLGIGALGDRTIISRGRDKLLRGGAEASAGPPSSHAAPAARDADTDTDGHGAGGDKHRGGAAAQSSKAGAEGSFKAKQGSHKKKPSRQERLRARNRLPARPPPPSERNFPFFCNSRALVS